MSCLDEDMTAQSVVDLRVNWTQAKLYTSGTLPNYEFLGEKGREAEDSREAYFVPVDVCGLTLFRDWIHEQNYSCKLYARFEWSASDFRSERRLLGFKFEFENVGHCAMFRLLA